MADHLDFDHLEGGRKKLPTWLLLLLAVASFGCTLVCLFVWIGS